MNRGFRIICALIIVLLWCLPAGAQSSFRTFAANGVPIDGPAITAEVDSVDTHISRDIVPIPSLRMPMSFGKFSTLAAPSHETRQERAMLLNSRIQQSLRPSVMSNNSEFFRPMPKYWYPIMLVAGFFLTPQFAIPYGYYPMMSPSNPFVIATIPGWAPEQQSMYSPDVIPQCVELEYDFATGKYKQKMVDWKVYQERVNSINPSNFNIAPVPRVPINDVERRIMSGNL